MLANEKIGWKPFHKRTNRMSVHRLPTHFIIHLQICSSRICPMTIMLHIPLWVLKVHHQCKGISKIRNHRIIMLR